MAAGSRTPRTCVASIKTATARPTPSCLKISSDRGAKIANTETITTAALVTTPRGALVAVRHCLFVGAAAVEGLADAREDEHAVVLRQAEQNHEQELADRLIRR